MTRRGSIVTDLVPDQQSNLRSAPVVNPSQNRSEIMTSVHDVTYDLLRRHGERGFRPARQPLGPSQVKPSQVPNLFNCALQDRAEDHGQTDGCDYSRDRPPSRVDHISKYFMPGRIHHSPRFFIHCIHCPLLGKLPVDGAYRCVAIRCRHGPPENNLRGMVAEEFENARDS